jgi:hypothetical protein
MILSGCQHIFGTVKFEILALSSSTFFLRSKVKAGFEAFMRMNMANSGEKATG